MTCILISIGNGVLIKSGATMLFVVPTVNLKSVFKAEPGAMVRIRQELRLGQRGRHSNPIYRLLGDKGAGMEGR